MKKETSIQEKLKAVLNSTSFSEEELKELEAFVDGFDDNQVLEEWLLENWECAEKGDPTFDFNVIKKKIEIDRKTPLIKSVWMELRPIAAALLIFGGIVSLWLYLANWNLEHERKLITDLDKHLEEKAQESRAVVLTKGSKEYKLSSSDLVLEDENIKAIGNENKLTYSSTQDSTVVERQQVWSTLSIPKTKDYYVVLSDGSKIWMNAGSTLTFPDFFEKDKREVFLEGEAYFEVVADIDMPFIVKTQELEVKVTGTHFNVRNYVDEPETQITLAEGKVAVDTRSKEVNLKPNEQVLCNRNTNAVQKKNVDASLYISWRDGVFEFREISLEELTYRLAKWYDVSFEFETENLKQLRFTGMVKKTRSIEYFLKVIEKTTDVHFSFDGISIRIKRA